MKSKKQLLDIPYEVEFLIQQLPYSTTSNGFVSAEKGNMQYSLEYTLVSTPVASISWETYYNADEYGECNHSTFVKSSAKIIVKVKEELDCLIDNIYDDEEIDFKLEELLALKLFLQKYIDNMHYWWYNEFKPIEN